MRLQYNFFFRFFIAHKPQPVPRHLGLKILRLNGWNIVIVVVGVVVDNDGDVDESNSPEWIENSL